MLKTTAWSSATRTRVGRSGICRAQRVVTFASVAEAREMVLHGAARHAARPRGVSAAKPRPPSRCSRLLSGTRPHAGEREEGARQRGVEGRGNPSRCSGRHQQARVIARKAEDPRELGTHPTADDCGRPLPPHRATRTEGDCTRQAARRHGLCRHMLAVLRHASLEVGHVDTLLARREPARTGASRQPQP